LELPPLLKPSLNMASDHQYAVGLETSETLTVALAAPLVGESLSVGTAGVGSGLVGGLVAWLV
jgi:hypothetical protein